MGKIELFEIEFGKKEAVYHPGEILEGLVKIVCTERLNINKVG
jgi:hypothetical protein